MTIPSAPPSRPPNSRPCRSHPMHSTATGITPWPGISQALPKNRRLRSDADRHGALGVRPPRGGLRTVLGRPGRGSLPASLPPPTGLPFGDHTSAADRASRAPMREGLVRSQRTAKSKGKEVTYSLPLSTYSARGALRQGPAHGAESSTEARTWGNQGFAKYVRLYRLWVLRDVKPPVGLAVWLRARGAEVRVCAPPDCVEQLAEMQPC